MSNNRWSPDHLLEAQVQQALSAEKLIRIEVCTEYHPEQSLPDSLQFVFSYTITISNQTEAAVTLLGRHWIITDANGNIREIEGVGVVGKQPVLEPGTVFEYSSGVILETPVGSMHGHYQLCYADGAPFLAEIAPFSLAMPDLVH